MIYLLSGIFGKKIIMIESKLWMYGNHLHLLLIFSMFEKRHNEVLKTWVTPVASVYTCKMLGEGEPLPPELLAGHTVPVSAARLPFPTLKSQAAPLGALKPARDVQHVPPRGHGHTSFPLPCSAQQVLIPHKLLQTWGCGARLSQGRGTSSSPAHSYVSV